MTNPSGQKKRRGRVKRERKGRPGGTGREWREESNDKETEGQQASKKGNQFDDCVQEDGLWIGDQAGEMERWRV